MFIENIAPKSHDTKFLKSFFFLFKQSESVKEFELNNLTRNIPPYSTNFTGLRVEQITLANATWTD